MAIYHEESASRLSPSAIAMRETVKADRAQSDVFGRLRERIWQQIRN